MLRNIFWHISEKEFPLAIERKTAFWNKVCMSFLLPLLKHISVFQIIIDTVLKTLLGIAHHSHKAQQSCY